MRGDVYRRGRRRTGSILAALGVALAVTVAAPAAQATRHAPAAQAARPTQARDAGAHWPSKPVAHAAGHKIA